MVGFSLSTTVSVKTHSRLRLLHLSFAVHFIVLTPFGNCVVAVKGKVTPFGFVQVQDTEGVGSQLSVAVITNGLGNV